MTDKILLVDDSQVICSLIRRKLENEMPCKIFEAHSLEAVQKLLERVPGPFLLAILDLNLPDAPNGEAVDYVTDTGIPAVVLTGTFCEDIRKRLFSKNIIDYLIKEGGEDLDQIVEIIQRLKSNQERKILVVDDSAISRQFLIRLLSRHRFQILEAGQGKEALALLEQHPDVEMVITDYNMPDMDGFQLIEQLRRKYGKDRLSIVGVSGSDDDDVTARFIKLGANDFLKKPFGVEELFSRINHNMEFLDMVNQIKAASNTDFLTKLYNRRYFFEFARRKLSRAHHEQLPMALAMVDIDHFKKINDTFGHDGGDLALVRTAAVLRHFFGPEDVLARFGGEEFCVLMNEVEPADALERMNQLGAQIRDMIIPFGQGKTIRLTVSIGLTTHLAQDLEAMIKTADERLYIAKKSGRDRVVDAD